MYIKIKEFTLFIRDIIDNRELIFDLAKNDFVTKYTGSILGIIWGYVKPLVTIGVFWFVFQVGFKSVPVNNIPFILWLICGIIPWFFFNEAWQSATNCLHEYSYLVKKVVFRVSVLPLVKILSALFVHMFFLFLIVIMFSIYGYKLDIIYLQSVYYLICTIALVMGLSLLTSSLAVFLKDVGQLIEVLLQIGFWITPIFWNYSILNGKKYMIIEINPMRYIIEGYRDTFINHIWFWEKINQSLLFWGSTILIFIVGAVVFRRLRTHFADVL